MKWPVLTFLEPRVSPTAMQTIRKPSRRDGPRKSTTPLTRRVPRSTVDTVTSGRRWGNHHGARSRWHCSGPDLLRVILDTGEVADRGAANSGTLFSRFHSQDSVEAITGANRLEFFLAPSCAAINNQVVPSSCRGVVDAITPILDG